MPPAITSADEAISATRAPANVPRRPRPLRSARRSMVQFPRCASCSATSSALGAWSIPAIRPSARRMTRSACAAATGSWVTITTVWPSTSTTSRRRPSTSRPVLVSSAPVGSSAKTTSGRVTSARAIATRCCWPPESWEGRWRSRWSRPTRAATSRTSERRGRRPSRRSGRPMFWVTVSEGIRLNAWKTNPIRSRLRIVSRRSLSPSSSVSPSATVPDGGRPSPAATCRSVLFPDPEGPMMAVNEPRENPMLIPSSATTAPSPSPWTLRTSRRATAGVMTEGAAISLVSASMSWPFVEDTRRRCEAHRRIGGGGGLADPGGRGDRRHVRAGDGARPRGDSADLAEHEAQDDADDHEARERVRDQPHPGAPEAPGGICLVDDAVDQRGRHAPGLVHVVNREERAVGDEIALPEGTSHARQEEAPEEQFLDHRSQEGDRDQHPEPTPVAGEEVLGTIGVDELGQIPGHGADRIDRKRVHGGGEHDEGKRPEPDLAADA